MSLQQVHTYYEETINKKDCNSYHNSLINTYIDLKMDHLPLLPMQEINYIKYHIPSNNSKGFKILPTDSGICYTSFITQYSHGIKHGIEGIYNKKDITLEITNYFFLNQKTKDFNESLKLFNNILIDLVCDKNLVLIIYSYLT